MGNIISDIVEDVDVKIKTSKTNFYLKWGVRIAISLVILAFAFGQIKMKHLNRLDGVEESQKESMKAIAELKQHVSEGFVKVNNRIDKIYDDGYIEFTKFQQYNNKQLELIIDYGAKNKDLLKKMLEVNTLERQKSVENSIQQAKNYNPEIGVKKIGQIGVKPISDLNYRDLITMINVNESDTTFNVIGSTKEYYDKISNTNRYKIVTFRESVKYPGLYDFTYKNITNN